MHTCTWVPATQAHTRTGLGGWDSKSSFVVSGFPFLPRELPSCAGYHRHLWAASPGASCGPSPAASVLPHTSRPSTSSLLSPKGSPGGCIYKSLLSPQHVNWDISVTTIPPLNPMQSARSDKQAGWL